MTTPATQLKIGLFVLCTLAAVIAIAVGFGIRMHAAKVRYHTYFDESVSGLEVGAPVDFRGVLIGNVGSIEVAPDRVRIDVALDLTEQDATRLRLRERAHALRARLESTGITGVKYVDLEPVAEEEPPPDLAFVPDLRYIPSRPSLLGELAVQAQHVGRRVPVLVDHATEAVDKLSNLLDQVRDQQLAARIRAAIDHTDAAVGDVRSLVRKADRAGLPDRAAAVLADLDAVAAKAKDVLVSLDGSGELEQTIRDLGDAARAFHDFVQEVEREPDVLLKGRARSKRL